MKKFCSWFLMVILVFSLAGCGGTRNNDVSMLSEEDSAESNADSWNRVLYAV